MGPKPVDNSVNERRLRPIYDWLDNGNNKKALQETEKLLKKQPNFQCAKVLKALAMVRLGRAEEAHVILKEVQVEEPCDDATLQGMVICYRETHRPELTCQIYEAAIKKDPANEELLSHLFMAYVRVGDYRKQQQTAMALYKAKPKNPYYFWAVMSIFMQTQGNNDKLSLTVTLPLAERMIKKFVDESKMEAEAEVQLYLMVLEKEQKFKEALEVLQGPLGEKLSAMTVEAKKAEYLRLLKMWDQAMDYHESLLRINPDQWSNYVQYVEAAFESSERDSALTRAKNFILSLADQEKEKVENKLRGPYLARLFFWQELKQKEIDAASVLGDFKTYAQDYINALGDKPCAFQDLRPFINSLPPDLAMEFLNYTIQAVGLKEGESPTNVKQICRHLLHLQLSRLLGAHNSLSRDEKMKLSEQLWDHYIKTMPLNVGLLPTDFRPNDGYALLASHILLDAWNDDPSLLKKCLAMLETALANSPANYHLKLLTMRVYTLAGHGRAALKRYETLDVKYIQLDSLGHLLCRPLISMGLPNAASPILSSSLRFYATHSRETSECLISAYKYGSFGKIVEFTQFCQRLDNSVHFAAVTTERMLLDLLFDGSTHAKLIQTASGMFADSHKDQPVWSACVDNRDCRIFVSWDPPAKQFGDDVIKRTFDADVQFARLRNRLTHAIIAAILYTPVNQLEESKADNQTNGQLVNGKSQTPLPGLVEELRSLREEYKTDTFLSYDQLSMQAPPPPRLYSYVESHCLDPLLILMGVICDGNHVTPEHVEKLKTAMGVLVESVKSPTKAVGCWKNYVRLERVYNATETLSLCALLASTLHAIIKSNHSSAKKKKKKGELKSESSDQLVENFSSLVNCVTCEMKRVETILDELDTEFSFDSLMLSDATLHGGDAERVMNEIKQKMSQSPSVDMKNLLADKLKLLESCNL